MGSLNLVAISSLTGLLLCGTGISAELSPAVSCESLQGRVFYNVTITRTERVVASAELPAHCRISGHEPGTEHDLEVRLPNRWQERYVQQGGGGFDGRIPTALQAPAALRLGAAQGANNGGHRDPTGASLLNNMRAVERYSHGAILIATRFGKAVTAAYYGRGPKHSYYEGCSNGGRGALNAAAKYGTEFDGVVAAAPTMNLTGQIAAWTSAATLSMPANAQFAQIHAAATARCDALDGTKDGVISNWQRCDFNPTHHTPMEVGLTAEQANSALTLMQDWKRKDGAVIYSGFGFGNMSPGVPAFKLFGPGQMRSIVHNNPNWSPADFNAEQSLPAISAVIDDKHQFSASMDGLKQFMSGGGRVLIWHGSDDALLSHRDTIRTWEALKQKAGENLLRESARLYIAPGVAHCAGGPGADSIDSLVALVDWVEQRKAPATLIASKKDAQTGAVKFTRPLCEYPAWPRYAGKGDPNRAENFSCATQ